MEETSELDSKLLLGRYRVVAQLAEGGMGKVYLARVEGAEGFQRPVVVKVMRPDMRKAEQGNRLFRREAQILSGMQHPAITNIIDFGTENGAQIMVLEYVHGYATSKWLDFRHARNLRVPVDIALYVVRRVLDALHYAHHFELEDGQVGEIVHRDVAADNVLFDHKGYVYLLDFGIASMKGGNKRATTTSGVFRGKLGYAAPETLGGTPATPRSDQYSAATLLWELLTLETPFQSDTAAETISRMLKEVLPPVSSLRPDVPAGLSEVLAQALAKQPEQRFDSVRTFSRELRRFQSEDDEEIAQSLRSIVELDFAQLPSEVDVEPLAKREQALARQFPAEEVRVADAGYQLDSSARATSPLATEEATKKDRLRSLLFGLLVVGGVVALALGAVVALLSRQESQQLVVVGGEKQGTSGSTRLANPSQEDAAGEDTPGEDASTPRAAAAPADTSKLTPEQSLAQAVQAQGTAFEECFVTHLDLAEKMPEATLHFSVPNGGGRAQLKVEPQALAGTELGVCLHSAGAAVAFPDLKRAISFRVPVRARFAELK